MRRNRRRAEALAEIDQAKTTFFSNVSHELRTPLTLMLSPVDAPIPDVLEARHEVERLRRPASAIRRSLERSGNRIGMADSLSAGIVTSKPRHAADPKPPSF
jgi:signal transduction histidine kinase